MKLRDDRPAYLGDIPRTLNYITGICRRYPGLAEFHGFLQEVVCSRTSMMDMFE